MRPIMFDIDGVLADFSLGFTTLANTLHGTPVTTTAQKVTWDGFPGLTDNQESVAWTAVYNSSVFLLNLAPLISHTVFERLNWLQACADVYFVTHRQGVKAKSQTLEWLASYGIRDPQVIISESKGETAKVIRAEYSIDDKAGNACAVAWLTRGTKTPCLSFILDRLYNQFDHKMIGGKVIRVYTVSEFLDYVENKL